MRGADAGFTVKRGSDGRLFNELCLHVHVIHLRICCYSFPTMSALSENQHFCKAQ